MCNIYLKQARLFFTNLIKIIILLNNKIDASIIFSSIIYLFQIQIFIHNFDNQYVNSIRRIILRNIINIQNF